MPLDFSDLVPAAYGSFLRALWKSGGARSFDKMRTLRAWKKATKLETLFEMNMQYIQGKLPVHPAHSISIFGETDEVADGLLTMNE